VERYKAIFNISQSLVIFDVGDATSERMVCADDHYGVNKFILLVGIAAYDVVS